MVESKRNSNMIFAMLLLYFVSIYISDSLPGGQLLTVLSLGSMLLFGLRQNKGVFKIYVKGYYIYILLFILFCSLSRIWAADPALAVSKINSIFFSFLAMLIIAFCTYNKQDIDLFLKTVMYGGYCVCLYVLVRYGWSGVLNILSSTSRISSELLNANTLGMCAAYSIIINFHYAVYEEFRPKDVLMLPAIMIIAASGSRKAILIFVAGIFGVMALKSIKDKRSLMNVVRVLFVIAFLLMGVIVIRRLPMFATVTTRLDNLISFLQGNETRSTSDAWIRFAYNRLGIQLFKEHPLLGIGIANANIYTDMYYGHYHYLHNNYIELLACGGIIGFTIYYSGWAYVLYAFIKCRNQRSRIYDICLLLLIIHIVMDYGAVFYYGKETYFYLFIFWIEAKMLLKERKHIIGTQAAVGLNR